LVAFFDKVFRISSARRLASALRVSRLSAAAWVATLISSNGFDLWKLLERLRSLPKRLDRAVSKWLFDQPDYGRLVRDLWSNLQKSDEQATWFSDVVATLSSGSGFAAAKIVELRSGSNEANAFAAHTEEAIFPQAGDPLRLLTEPPAQQLLPLRVHGEAITH
jgi:hypothetical protein